ncbi:MAG: DNA repair protein RecN [Zoogloeaceae bacterium]|jgi:DNA repair protein RecN (Recombination protein N)|nr:DNA repair protein RecN [Zoogloeaceae bacterium]
MLIRLEIQHFVIVEHLELEFHKGFTALTGETGAGKSILVDALALALGARADPCVVACGQKRAEIAATFDVAPLPLVRKWLADNDFPVEEELLLRRVVEVSGRSRAYINGSAASVQQIKSVGEFLVDIHGQHAYQSLLRAEYQRDLLDAYGGLTNLARQVADAWQEWQYLATEFAAIQAGNEAKLKEKDMLTWQIHELEEANFSPEEWPDLEAEQRRLAHAEALTEHARRALAALCEEEGACEERLSGAAESLGEIAALDEEMTESLSMLRSAQAELAEVATALRRYADRLEIDPERLLEVEERQKLVLSLARKHHVEISGLPEALSALRRRHAELSAHTDLETFEVRVKEAFQRYHDQAARLSSERAKCAEGLSEAVSRQMQNLAMSQGCFVVCFRPLKNGTAHGYEQPEFCVAGLASDQNVPLSKVASGGELSRISLALQVVVTRGASVATLIFDEVDVGIGGGVAEVVGRLLAKAGEDRQVLCVTHLPQVAACAAEQWQVSKEKEKDRMVSRIDFLDDEGREREIARMLGGLEITETTLQHARELLASGAKNRLK